MLRLNTHREGWPVGLLFSGQSQTAAVEHAQACATLLAIDEVNAAGGINGVPLVPRQVDIGPQPTTIDLRRKSFATSRMCGCCLARTCPIRARQCCR
jgi:branched-chain amino acid transport system substrate-binding protein